MKNDNIFKKGDRVFHFVFGWGSVTGDSEKGVCDVVFEDRKSVAIPCKEIHLSFCKYDLINGGLSHERPFVLEVGKSYVAKSISAIVINRVGDYGNYGFYIGDWGDKIPCYTPEIWREATDEEVRSALEKETIRRFGENWKDVKIVKSIGMSQDGDNEGVFDVEVEEYSRGWEVWNKNGLLFQKGVWAEKLEEYEFKPFQKVLVRDEQGSAWRIELFSSMTGNKHSPYRCLTTCWGQCIPYEGNEHLLGTTKSPEK